MIRTFARKVDDKWVVPNCPICGQAHTLGNEKHDQNFKEGNRVMICQTDTGPVKDRMFIVILEGLDQIIGFVPKVSRKK